MTPLVLLVGFLGSGKTTFLKKFLPALKESSLSTYIIINDYQNAAVDAEQLQSAGSDVRALTGDCVCCGSKEDLLAELEKFDHAPGRIMVVEANGTTDSEQLIEMLSLEPALTKFSLPVQLSVVDTQRWQKRFWHNSLELDQTRTASHLYLSRQDVVKPERLTQVRQSLEKHGIRAIQVSVEEFAGELAGMSAEIANLAGREAFGEHHDCGEHCGHDHHDHEGHDHDHHEHNHHDHEHAAHHFSSFEIGLPATVSRSAMKEFLKGLPEEVIRAKGMVCFDDQPGEFYIFQKVDRQDEPQFFPVGKTPRLNRPLALFIGPQLPEAAIRESVSSLA